MHMKHFSIKAVLGVWVLLVSMTVNAAERIVSVPLSDVKLKDHFWSHRQETNRLVTIPHLLREHEKQGSLNSFAFLAGKTDKYTGNAWTPISAVYKTLEAMAYSLRLQPDPTIKKRMEEIIALIVGAQAEDGYLVPHTLIAEPDYQHFSKVLENATHELYTMGHMIESGIAHFETTGRRNYLDAGIKSADLIGRTYGPGRKEEPSSHPEIEIALVKLYHLTGKRAYLDLAAFLIEQAKHTNCNFSSHGKPALGHDEALGHAVAMLYLYSAAVDVASLTGDQDLQSLMQRKWKSIVGRKMYITGGVGHRDHYEGFAADYVLPNSKSYSETCASISHVMFNHRMFLAHGDARYMDVAERILYNGFLSGVGLSGDRFFYDNLLESDGDLKAYEFCERKPWFSMPCCPPNVARYLEVIPSLTYATAGDQLYVNLFIAGKARFKMKAATVQLQQETRYPWDGKVKLSVDPEKTQTFTLKVRIPGWAQNQPVPSDLYRYKEDKKPEVKLVVNDKKVDIKLDKGYAVIRRRWSPGDVVTLDMEMSVRRVLAHENVKDNTGRFAIERGPLVYCAEGADNDGKVLAKVPGSDVSFELVPRPDLLDGIVQIEMKPKGKGDPLTLIPYYAWCNRGPNEMAVWLKE